MYSVDPINLNGLLSTGVYWRETKSSLTGKVVVHVYLCLDDQSNSVIKEDATHVYLFTPFSYVIQ